MWDNRYKQTAFPTRRIILNCQTPWTPSFRLTCTAYWKGSWATAVLVSISFKMEWARDFMTRLHMRKHCDFVSQWVSDLYWAKVKNEVKSCFWHAVIHRLSDNRWSFSNFTGRINNATERYLIFNRNGGKWQLHLAHNSSLPCDL